MSDPAPTFANNRDRLTYLVAEYKLLIGGMVIGLALLAVYYQVSLPTLPTWIPALLVGWMLLAVPCFLVGKKIATWLRNRNWVTVHHVNAAEDVLEKHNVPPEVWTSKKVEGPDPYPVNGGSAWAVREYEWLDDVEELRVKGVWLEGCRDTELMTSKKQMKDIHGWLIDRAEELAALRGRWSRGAVQLQQKLVNTEAEALERGQMLQKTGAKDTFEDMMEDGEDFDDAPTVHDLVDDPDADPFADPGTIGMGMGDGADVQEGPADE